MFFVFFFNLLVEKISGKKLFYFSFYVFSQNFYLTRNEQKKRRKKGRLFHVVLYDGDELLSPLQLIVGTSKTVLRNVPKSLSWTWNTEKEKKS